MKHANYAHNKYSIRQEEQRTVTVYVGAECMYTLSVCLTGTALTVIGEN